MEKNWLERTELLVGAENLEQLNKTNILVVGLGGVGSFAAEFLCRAGVGKMTIVDGDVVDLTNTNRQLPALHSTVGQSKAELMGNRMKDINPAIDLTVIQEFLMPERMSELVATGNFNFVLDCIDSLQPKLHLISACQNANVPIICSMGAGGRIDPAKVKVSDILKTYNCPFAEQVRRGLKRNQVKPKDVKAVFSDELVSKDALRMTDGSNFKRSFYGTISYIPALFGLHMAAYVVRKLGGLKL